MANSILILDDEHAYAEMLCDLLVDNGYAAEFATDPRQALERLHEKSFALIVSDFRMPEVDGAQFLTEARRIVPQLPVIMVSGLMTTPDLLKVANIGVTLVLEKPFQVEVFLDHVRRFVKPASEASTAPEEGDDPAVADTYPRPPTYLVDDSSASQGFLQRLWEAGRSGAKHILVRIPRGGEFGECVREFAAWRGFSDRSSFHFSLAELDSVEVRQAIRELAAGEASPCVAITTGDDAPFDPGVFARFVEWIETQPAIHERFTFLYRLPAEVEFDNAAVVDGPRDDRIAGPLTMAPLRDRLVDLATFVSRFLEKLPPESRATFEPAAVAMLLQYEWPDNHRELMAVLRRSFSAAGGGVVRAENVEATIRSRHGLTDEVGESLNLESFLLLEQRRYLRRHALPDADLKSLAEVSGVGLDRLRAGRSPAEQPFLFPELIPEGDDCLKDDIDGPGH